MPVPPERDLAGPDMDAGTGIPGAHLRGMHLRLPGRGDEGPRWRFSPIIRPWGTR